MKVFITTAFMILLSSYFTADCLASSIEGEWSYHYDSILKDPIKCTIVKSVVNNIWYYELNDGDTCVEEGIISHHPMGYYVYVSTSGDPRGGTIVWNEQKQWWAWIDTTVPLGLYHLEPTEIE